MLEFRNREHLPLLPELDPVYELPVIRAESQCGIARLFHGIKIGR
jgi:hypothetical protein